LCNRDVCCSLSNPRVHAHTPTLTAFHHAIVHARNYYKLNERVLRPSSRRPTESGASLLCYRILHAIAGATRQHLSRESSPGLYRLRHLGILRIKRRRPPDWAFNCSLFWRNLLFFDICSGIVSRGWQCKRLCDTIMTHLS